MDEAIQAVLDSSDYIAGDQVEELEKELAEYVGVKNCVSCGNGTDALVLALKAWGIGAGDAVFVPDHTFFSSAESVAFVGATPVFADVHEDTFNVDVESMERCHGCGKSGARHRGSDQRRKIKAEGHGSRRPVRTSG